jgi:hypothetical protein
MPEEKVTMEGIEYKVVEPLIKGTHWNKTPKVLEGPDGVQRLEKLPSDRLQVRITIELSGAIRRADLDRFAQTMSKSVAFEFENGGNGT